MKFKLMFTPDDIVTREFDGFDDCIRFCMINCKRLGLNSFMFKYKCETDSKKTYEYLCDLKKMNFCAIIRYAGCPLPLRYVIDNIDMDMSFLNDVVPISNESYTDDDLPF